MDENGRREVGLFRYALIRDAADPALSKAERGRLVRAVADRGHVAPDGRLVRIGRTTLDEWIRAYRHGGFEALVPRPRVVVPRTPAEVLELAFALKRERPDRTAAQVREIMLAAGGHAPGLRTLQTHLARAGLNVRADGRSPGKVYGRFEASARNELWTGDGLHGPKLDGVAARRAVLMAFIDDHSRLLVGWRWGDGEDVLRLEAALRPGLMARGVPEAILVDFVPRNKIDLLCPNRLCGCHDAAGRGHGGRPLGDVAVGHIMVRARRASSGASRRSARLGWCGIPRQYPVVRF